MKSHKKSTRMMQRALGVVAISFALLMFSVLGVVALLTSARANGMVASIASDTAGVTPSPSADATATQAPTPTPTQLPTPTQMPTQAPTPTKVPTKTPPTSTPTTPPNNPTPVPTMAGSGSAPVVGTTPTAAALGPGGTQATPTPRKGKPTPTPSPSPTNTPAGSAQGAAPSATTGHTPGTTTGSHNGMMTPLTASLAGASAFIVLSTTGLVGLVVWRRRKATLAQAAGAQAAQNPWPEQPVAPADNYYSQPTEFSAAAPAANGAMIPFALQGFSQYSPLLSTPNVPHQDAPTPLPSSDFRPLQLDFPQIIGQADGAPVHTPLPTQQPADLGTSFPQSPPSTPAQAEPARVDLQPTLPGNPSEQPVLQSDPFLEAMMQRVQMGIFALPGKDS
jgi:hypothetical protein